MSVPTTSRVKDRIQQLEGLVTSLMKKAEPKDNKPSPEIASSIST